MSLKHRLVDKAAVFAIILFEPRDMLLAGFSFVLAFSMFAVFPSLPFGISLSYCAVGVAFLVTFLMFICC